MNFIESEIAYHVGQINRQVVGRAKRGTVIMRNAASEVLGKNGTGRRYKNGHVASAPGQAPAPDAGNLRRNWRKQSFVAANGLGRGIDVKLRITSDVPYSGYLEFGTRFISPRPFVKRIRDKAMPDVQALFSGI